MLDPTFYHRSALLVAPDLLGKIFVRRLGTAELRGQIVEVEAYCGADDPGSHAFRGRTKRNAVMFGPPGHLYVYFTYGMHFCMNVVTASEGTPEAVLIRALEPIAGIEEMADRRGGRPIEHLCNGPGKVCQALGIDCSANGESLLGPSVWIEDHGCSAGRVGTSTRIGLSAGSELPYRFFLPGNRFLSRRA